MAQIKPVKTKHWLALLTTLFVIVLIAHLAIITSARGQFSAIKSAQTETFTTRMIELAAPTPVVEKVPEVVTPSKPVKPNAKVAVRPPLTQDAPALLPAPVENTLAAPPPVAELIPPSPEPIPATQDIAAKPAFTSGESGQPPPAFAVPVSAKHVYKVIVSQKGSVYEGKADALLQQDGEKYALSLSASQLLYSITWKSSGMLSPQGFMPERFSDKRTLKSEVAAHFDRNAGKIIFSANTPQAELESGAQDRLSIIWQLAGQLAAEPARYMPGTTISVQTADDREAQTWVFTVNEPETLNLANGSQIAWRLTRNPRREFDRKIELWFAPAMGYLLVRFRQTQTGGDYDDMVWQSTQELPPPTIK